MSTLAFLPSWSMSTALSVGAFAGVLTGFPFGTVPFSTSASSLSLASHLPDSMQGMPDKDVLPVPTSGTLEFNKW